MTKELKDYENNSIIAIDLGSKINLFLKLKNEDRKRRVGTINKRLREIVMKRDREKHLHRLSQSYGFNFEILNTATKFEKVRLKDESGQWLIEREFILNNGSFLHFQKQGFEKQILVSLEQLKQFRLRK